jgi:hypothetical protein
MVKLILKDFKATKHLILYQLAFWVFILSNSRQRGFPFIIVSLIIVFQVLLVDDRYRTEALYVSLPVKRSTIVYARYFSAFLVIAVMTVLTFIAGVLVHTYFPQEFKGIIPIKSLVAPHLAVLILIALIYPVFFRFGAYLEAGMKIVAITVIGLTVFVFGLVILFNNLGLDPFAVKHSFLYWSIFTVLLVIGSMWFSLRIYRKREF